MNCDGSDEIEEDCPTCNGSGFNDSSHNECENCLGSGDLNYAKRRLGNDELIVVDKEKESTECPICDGSGIDVNSSPKSCVDCEGKGIDILGRPIMCPVCHGTGEGKGGSRVELVNISQFKKNTGIEFR